MPAVKRFLPVVVMLVVMVGGLLLIPAQVNRLSDIRLEETRTQLPGEREVTLDDRKYIVWIESRSADLTKFSPSPDQIPVTIRPAGGTPLTLRDYSGSFTTQSGGREGAAFATVTPPSDGDYVIAGDAPQGIPAASVVLGNPTRNAVLKLILGIALAVVGLIGAIVAVVLAIVLPRKDRPTDDPRSPVAGGDPFNA